MMGGRLRDVVRAGIQRSTDKAHALYAHFSPHPRPRILGERKPISVRVNNLNLCIHGQHGQQLKNIDLNSHTSRHLRAKLKGVNLCEPTQ